MFTSSKLRVAAATILAFSCVEALVDPTEIYTGGLGPNTSDVALRIATGGAGQSGLVKGICESISIWMHSLTSTLALSDAFIQQSVKNGSQPFSIGWVRPFPSPTQNHHHSLLTTHDRPGPQRHHLHDQEPCHRRR